MLYTTEIIVSQVISLLWFFAYMNQRRYSFPLKNFFFIHAYRNLVVLILIHSGFYFQNTVYHISGLLMISVLVNPKAKLGYFSHSLVKFYFFAVFILIAHLKFFYLDKNYLFESYLHLITYLVMVAYLILASMQRLQYELTLNYYILFLLSYYLFGSITLVLNILNFELPSFYNTYIELGMIFYFSIANYNKSKPIFKFGDT